MTKLQIVSKLWSVIYDLVFLIIELEIIRQNNETSHRIRAEPLEF